MSDLNFALDILIDELNELRQMQYSPKHATGEMTFKKRTQSLELAIEKLTEANGIATSESGLHIADVIGRFLFNEADLQQMHGIEDITAGLENRQDEKGRYKLVIYDADYKELKHYWVNAL